MPAPHTLSQLQSNKNIDKDFLIIENQQEQKSNNKDLVINKSNKPTTLTIVQDFPKKKVDEMKANNVEMV